MFVPNDKYSVQRWLCNSVKTQVLSTLNGAHPGSSKLSTFRRNKKKIKIKQGKCRKEAKIRHTLQLLWTLSDIAYMSVHDITIALVVVTAVV